NPIACPAVFCVNSQGSDVSLALKLNAPLRGSVRYTLLLNTASTPPLKVWLFLIQVRLALLEGRNAKIESPGSPFQLPGPKRIMPPWPVQGGGCERLGAGPATHKAPITGNLWLSPAPFSPMEAGSNGLPAKVKLVG